MASRISQRSRRSSRSFSRLTWKRAMGIAAEARIATMATQMMSSTRVRPDSGLGALEWDRPSRDERASAAIATSQIGWCKDERKGRREKRRGRQGTLRDIALHLL